LFAILTVRTKRTWGYKRRDTTLQRKK
jgi:hypothetical protein